MEAVGATEIGAEGTVEIGVEGTAETGMAETDTVGITETGAMGVARAVAGGIFTSATALGPSKVSARYVNRHTNYREIATKKRCKYLRLRKR